MRYPVTSRRSVLDCPVHDCAVPLDEQGRVAGSCPDCRAEARRVIRRWAARRRRALAVA